MKYVKRTIEECVRDDAQFDPYAKENIVYFKSCVLKVYHDDLCELGRSHNNLYKETPDHPNASRTYDLAIDSHERFHIRTSKAYAAAYTDPETVEDRKYVPERIYARYEDKLLSLSKLPIPPKLNINFESIIEGAIMAPGDSWAGFVSMFNPVTCWKTMNNYIKVLTIFAIYQYVAFFVPVLLTIEYYTLWQIVKFMFFLVQVFVMLIMWVTSI